MTISNFAQALATFVLNVDQNFPNAREPLQLQLLPEFKLS